MIAALAIVLAAVTYLVGRAVGVRRGREEENLRVQSILHQAVQIVGHGGRVQTIWQRVAGSISREAMEERLRESQKERDSARKRLAAYEEGRLP